MPIVLGSLLNVLGTMLGAIGTTLNAFVKPRNRVEQLTQDVDGQAKSSGSLLRAFGRPRKALSTWLAPIGRLLDAFRIVPIASGSLLNALGTMLDAIGNVLNALRVHLFFRGGSGSQSVVFCAASHSSIRSRSPTQRST